ncbi:hypothetical protein RDWZM_007904 [Blomia tropicalis]|uniref:Autophagy-related protein 2 n=1 Tax=Blomia tropicalis TaxID=40697 RepID=A0A9Q0M2I4_BLOTA|nr:hypothetical protein RDWZM_007904 [Blomia tropicalis]
MAWLTESFKKCAVKYLLQRNLGCYLSRELDLSQLNVELINGKGSIDDIPLDVNAINDEVSKYVPLKFLSGTVDRIELAIPWSSLWTESCAVCLRGIELHIELDRRNRTDLNQTSILSKSLMTSSMEIAEEIVNQESEKYEGLEKMAQLINSVIRRFQVTLQDLRLKFALNEYVGDQRQIEFRIGEIGLIEEHLQLNDKEKMNNDQTQMGIQQTLSDVVTKQVMITDIEVLINGTLITKLRKHKVNIRFDGNRIDVDAVLPFIYAILNTEHLNVILDFIQMFSSKDESTTSGSTGLMDCIDPAIPKEMTGQDYRLMQEMMRYEDRNHHRNNLIGSSMLSNHNHSKNWTTSIDDDEERFMPFNHNYDQRESNVPTTQLDESNTMVTTVLKFPGLVLCLITDESDESMPSFREMPTYDNMPSFIGVNNFLNETLNEYDHIRLLAPHLTLEIRPEQFQFSCANISMYEYHDEMLNNFLSMKSTDANAMQSNVRLRLVNNELKITLSATSAKLDPTFIERHHKLMKLFETNRTGNRQRYRNISTSSLNNVYNGTISNNDEPFNVIIECEKLDLEMYFPIPDLRQERNQLSNLHDEILFIELTEMELRLDAKSGDLVCSQIDIDILVDDRQRKIFHSKSDSTNISLSFSTETPTHVTETEIDSDYILNGMESMHESINYFTASTMNHNKNYTNPFQVKRKMFDDDGLEQILTPGDRDHVECYLNSNRGSSRIFVRVDIPFGEMYLENKAMFELIYNRFVNDLILWTPYFPKKIDRPELILPSMMMESDGIFKSVLTSATIEHHLSESQTEDMDSSYTIQPAAIDSSASNFLPMNHNNNNQNNHLLDSITSDNSYHSILDNSTVPGALLINNNSKPNNEFMLELNIDCLSIDFYTQSGQKNNLFTQKLLVGIVVGPETERTTTICLNGENLSLKYDDRHILIGNTYLDSHCCSIGMSIDIKRETDLLKKIKLAVQMRQALLVGLELPIYDELYEFVNLKDDEIIGYVCPKVIVELHTDIVQCGISFDNLKERPTLLHCEDIYLTSMVVENTSQTILRFFIEEAFLCFKRNNHCHEMLKNYIAVIDSGIIDINLKISKDGRLELKISNNEINVKVCPDSLATLCQFLQLFATQVSGGDCTTSSDDTTMDMTENSEIYMKKNNLNGTDLIADALNECSNEYNDRMCQNYDGDDLNNYEDDEKENEDDDNGGKSYRMSQCINCDGGQLNESNFWILGDDDLGTGINLTKEPQVRVLTDKPIRMVENYFKQSNYNVMPEITASTLARYVLEKMSLRVSLYGGKDFDDIPMDDGDDQSDQRTYKPDAISLANMSIRSGRSLSTLTSNMNQRDQKVRFQQNSVVWENIDLISNNGYLTNMTNESHFNFKNSGGTKRKNDTCVVLMLNRIKLLFENFDKDYDLAWRFFFLVQEIEIIDRVNASRIKKILYEYISQTTPRRKYSNMFSIRLTCNRNFQDNNEECDLKISLKPLRVNIDQDTLIFLMEFFQMVNEILTNKLQQQQNNGIYSKHSDNSSDNKFGDDEDDDDDEQQHVGRTSSMNERIRRTSTSSNSSFDNLFIKSFTFSPDVPIRLDYHGKHIDLKQGALPGIFLGLAQLNQSELHLKKLSNKHGILGFEKVLSYVIEEWAKDIKRNQLPSILGGVGPMHSFIQLFQGIRDLFWMPIDQYRRDQRIVRGIQRGAYAFSISTAMATLELANRLVSLIQSTAQFAHDVVTPPTPGGSGSGGRSGLVGGGSGIGVGGSCGNNGTMSTFHNSQPRDFREGITVAYTVMREGMHDTVRAVANAGMVSDDMGTVFGEVVRQIPSTLVRPFIHVSQATSSVLVGMRNQLTPEARKDDHEKWKNANER